MTRRSGLSFAADLHGLGGTLGQRFGFGRGFLQNIAWHFPATDMKRKHRSLAASAPAADLPMGANKLDVLIPGEIEHRTRLQRERDGIPLPAELFGELAELGRRYGISAGLTEIAVA